ncbi:hypothetical protein SODALDRAFT_318009 [Sodiomyces alkalinus F11]|uniref:HTH TFE/IIEalpha-type domain-containing protein n=1 Tax=Sodiomyces alkalinus (strain CBS 110278 / VKM F-3762 / F11) TaxID=1314773 RepID=A0A3N2PK31_SODAK|nr:hypothetical protein SODALDRAFT_318009 [Sodiomyces alkalinus F11]ROT34790.1 hypothetical protein SODALDRAFT_318009 [Sodiomyces alkalinus F11]
MTQPLELAKSLVRSVVRALYDIPNVLIIDALVIHSALKDEDLRFMLGMNTKEVHRLCGKLREDRFLGSYTRHEQSNNPEQKRLINKQYYYIDYRQAIDAIKWRVYTADKDVQGTNVPASERKEYFCSRCKAEWTQMEVLDKVSAQGFLCHNCDYPLMHDPERYSTGHQESTRLNEQFKFITEMLPRIDDVIIPDNTFDIAISAYKPLAPEVNHGPGSTSFSILQPMAVKGLDNLGPKYLSVNISTSNGPSDADKAADQARRDKIAQQNALPSWMSNSTITGESFSANQGTPVPVSRSDEHDTGKPTAKTSKEHDDTELARMFAAIKAQQEADAARALAGNESEEEEDEEDDNHFEDVVTAGTQLGGVMSRDSAQHSLKRMTSVQGETSEERGGKKLKTGDPDLIQLADEDESEGEVEFEDVS